MEKTLISMTDFVLEETNRTTTLSESFQKCVTYAKLLKQPLKLGMFVPCDENDVPLEEPDEKYSSNVEFYEIFEQYQQAKERVLFEGFYFDISGWITNKNGLDVAYITIDNKISFEYETIEDLVKYNLKLTNKN